MIDNISVGIPYTLYEFNKLKNSSIYKWNKDKIRKSGKPIYVKGKYVSRDTIIFRLQIENITVRYYNTSEMMYISGSWAKLWKGNNIETLTIIDTIKTFFKIVDKSGVHIYNNKLSSIEFGVNLFLEKEVKEYNNLIVGYKKSAYKEDSMANRTSLYYKTKNNQVLLYDKLAEVKARNKLTYSDYETDISDYEGKNILRFEIKVKKSLNKYFKETEYYNKYIYVNDLLYPEFWNIMIDKLVDVFKNELLYFTDYTANAEIRTQKDLINYFLVLGKHYHESKKMKLNIKLDKKKNKSSISTIIQRMKKKYNSIAKLESSTKHPLIEELHSVFDKEILKLREMVEAFYDDFNATLNINDDFPDEL